MKGDYKKSDLYYYPQTEQEMKQLFEEDILKENIIKHILKYYPNINNLTIDISNKQGCRAENYIGNDMHVYINIAYINGPKEWILYKLKISTILRKHFKSLEIPIKYYNYNYDICRHYSDDIMLKACKKYADCICKNLEINMANINYLKVGSVSLYDLAILDLNNIDYIEKDNHV